MIDIIMTVYFYVFDQSRITKMKKAIYHLRNTSSIDDKIKDPFRTEATRCGEIMEGKTGRDLNGVERGGVGKEGRG